ncbi:MAG: hypothetical protein JSU68_04085 [Phycisphaerales bacterium]|nr:MAG: hypothetical protein JSU68_04085 [Phycisphaerales bacterium]
MSAGATAITVLVSGSARAVALIAAWWNRGRRKKSLRRIDDLHELWARSGPPGRSGAFRERLREHDESPEADRPGSEAARAEIAFFAGCAHLEEQDARAAARMFQVAYHADPKLSIALVLAFGCLKVGTVRAISHEPLAVSSQGTVAGFWDELADRCGETWHELGRPRVSRSHGERALLSRSGRLGEVLRPVIARLGTG